MKRQVLLISLFSLLSSVYFSNGAGSGDHPRWLFLGDDDGLIATYNDAAAVVSVCIYATDLEDVEPPFATVVHNVTVVRCLKGGISIGSKIEIVYKTDSLPASDFDRRNFIEEANLSAEGDLRFAFLREAKGKRFFIEFLDLPDYSDEMSFFLEALIPK